jgi:hypothetical protein
MKKIVCLTFCLASHFVMAVPSYQINEDQTEITIKTEYCIYGRGVNDALKQTSFESVQKDIRSNKEQILDQLGESKELSPTTRQFITLLLSVGLQPEDFEHEIFFQGNDTCSKATAQLKVDPKQNFETLFDFTPPKILHFTAPLANELSVAGQMLKDYGIALDTTTLANQLQRHSTYTQLGVEKGYFTLDIAQYQQALSGNTNSVFISGSEQFLPILNQYLFSKGFEVVSSPSNAYWSINLSGQIEESKYLNFSLTLANQKTGKQRQINNTPRALPGINMSNQAAFEKFFKVHLELIKLTSLMDVSEY